MTMRDQQRQLTEDLVLIGDSLSALVDIEMAGAMDDPAYALLTVVADLFDEIIAPDTDLTVLVAELRGVYPQRVRASHMLGSDERNERSRGRRAGEEE